MKLSDILEELERQEEELDENIPLEKLDSFIEFIKSIDVESLEFSSKDELENLSKKIESIINKVVFLKNEIMQKADRLSKNKDATTAYMKSQLNNR
ncbi:MAG: hypothetical protein DSY47_03860 [Hydrogenothermus sp.]|nr:MAG: hypothetical protein DSY47_03860 [Hydrogenothermus sp.]